jgi:undecaprenyl-diphosphatase
MVFVIVGLVTLLAALFVKLADSVRENENVVRLDRNVLTFMLRHRDAWLSRFARYATLLGSGWVVAIVVTGFAIFLIFRHRPVDALFVVVSTVGTAVLVATTKHLIGRPRPAGSDRLVAASGAAFPSGHAAQSIACYAALAVIVVIASRSTTTRVLALTGAAVIALLVGASRVYLGVHWTSDVVSGWLLATGWLLTLVGVRLGFQTGRK